MHLRCEISTYDASLTKDIGPLHRPAVSTRRGSKIIDDWSLPKCRLSFSIRNPSAPY